MSTKNTPAPVAKSGALAAPDRLAELAERCASLTAAAKGRIAETFALAAVVQELRGAVLPLVPSIRPLIGTPLGFRTDRDMSDKGPYPDGVIADVLVEASARGLRWTGNEINVIGGRLYVTKEGYTRLVAELPGLTDLELTPSPPRIAEGGGGAVVKYRATWKLDGVASVLEREIPVRLNAGMGADGAIGKATRKMLAAIHGRVTGSIQSLADSDAEDVEPNPRPTRTSALTDRLARRAEPLPPAAPTDHIPGVGDPDHDRALFPAQNTRGLPD